MDGLHGLRAWRWMFIIEGTITVGVAFSAFFVLPNFPRTTTWLTEEERQMAVWRMEEDVGQDDFAEGDATLMTGFKLAFTDVKTYILVSRIFRWIAMGLQDYLLRSEGLVVLRTNMLHRC